jgi:hypothetical protein
LDEMNSLLKIRGDGRYMIVPREEQKNRNSVLQKRGEGCV